METLLTRLLRMAGFTKKIIATLSQNVVDSILIHTSCHPRQSLPLLWAATQEKTVQARAFAVGHVKTFVDCHGLRSKHTIESAGGADILEKCVKKGLADQNPGVREQARLSFWSFEAVWKDRGRAILEGLDATARKQLQNVCPVPLTDLNISIPSTPVNKKSSVAAAIAASRAKAKQIATAPPTLRHQATSTSHAQASRATSPPASVKRSTSPVVNAHATPSPPARLSSSPPRSSLLRNTNSPPTAGHSRHRTTSTSPSPPSSPTIESHRRQRSSPLVAQPSNGTVRGGPRASSPPASPGPGSSFNPRASALRASLRSAAGSQQAGSPRLGYALDPDESLLIATTIPLPAAESEFGDDDSVNLMTFSAPWELSNSASASITPSKSTPSMPRVSRVPDSVVEDALRARAAQAESAAEQLLELVEPDDGTHPSPIPLSLLPNNRKTPKPPVKTLTVPPVTPLNHTSAIMRQAALFQDSPAYKSGSPSIFELIEERKHQTGWWLKRMTSTPFESRFISLVKFSVLLTVVDQIGPIRSDFTQCVNDLEEYTAALQKGVADLHVLRKLVLLCHRNVSPEVTSPPVSPAVLGKGFSHNLATLPPSPSPGASLAVQDGPVPMVGDIWDGGGRLEKLFSALCDFLRPERVCYSLLHDAITTEVLRSGSGASRTRVIRTLGDVATVGWS